MFTTSKKATHLMLTCMAWLASTTCTHAQSYITTDLNSLGAFEPAAMNNLGQIAGTIGSGSMGIYDFTSGLLQTVQLSQRKPVIVRGINDVGVVAGNLLSQPFIYANGTTTAVSGLSLYVGGINNSGAVVADTNPGVALIQGGVINRIYTTAYANDTSLPSINNAGVVAATLNDAQGFHAAVYSQQGGWTNIAMPANANSAYQGSEAYDINDNGDVVGSYYSGNAMHGFFWHAGTSVDVGAPLDNFKLTKVNNRGQAVGTIAVEAGAYLYSDGQLIDLDKLAPQAGWRYTEAIDINDKGQILLAATPLSSDSYLFGSTGYFLLTPVPEANAWVMLLAGGVAIATLSRRRKSA